MGQKRSVDSGAGFRASVFKQSGRRGQSNERLRGARGDDLRGGRRLDVRERGLLRRGVRPVTESDRVTATLAAATIVAVQHVAGSNCEEVEKKLGGGVKVTDERVPVDARFSQPARSLAAENLLKVSSKSHSCNAKNFPDNAVTVEQEPCLCAPLQALAQG